MIKILACADLHLDILRRLKDTVNSLNQIRDYAIACSKQDQTKVIVLGDIYQRRRPYSIEKQEFHKFIKDLLSNNIQVTIIPGLTGMHDNQHGVTTIEEFETLKIEGVTVLPNKSIITINNNYKIFLGHLMLKEAKLGALGYGVDSDALSVEELIKKYPADIYLLGHVHKAQKVNKNPPVLYAGSIDRVTFGERDEVKGFIEIRLSSIAQYSFISLKTRKMKRITIDKQWIDLGKPNFDVEDMIIQVDINCKREDMKLFKEPEIRRALRTAHTVKDIRYKFVDAVRVRNKAINEKINPLNAFVEYAKQKKLDMDLIVLGRQIIKEVEEE